MLRREAATWLARLQSGRDPGAESKFQRWRDADPKHAAAFESVKRSYEEAGLLRHSPVSGSTHVEPPIRKRRLQAGPALAAAAVLTLVPIAALLVRGGQAPFGGTEAVMLMTDVGQIKQISLADGSKVTLDTATRVDVQIERSRRTAHLRYGRARFQIASAAEPFQVETATASITARDGMLEVEQSGQQGRVQVLSGVADVRASNPGAGSRVAAVGAGEAVTVDSVGGAKKAIVGAATDWTRGMLQFDGTPLTEAVTLANRYSKRRIILAGDFASLKVTGAFRAGDTAGLAKALAAAFRASLQLRADGNLVLSRIEGRGRQNKKGG